MPHTFTTYAPSDPVLSADLNARAAAIVALEDGSAFYLVTAGTGNAFTVAPSPAWTAYAAGNLFLVQADRANSGSATLNVSALGAKTIKLNGANLTSGVLATGRIYLVVYDGTDFQIVGSSGGAVVFGETPSGLINSSNTAYTLAATPSGPIALYLRGVRLIQGVDYSISGANITMTTAPLTGDNLIADYRT